MVNSHGYPYGNMYEYQKNGRFFAQTAGQLRDLASEEILAMGARDLSPVHRGIHFHADMGAVCEMAYRARTLSRILAPLHRFKCHSTRYLYNRARQIDWPGLFSADRSFAVFSSVANSRIHHSQYASLKLKDAIVDAFQEAEGDRPSVNRHYPDLHIGLHIENDTATISLDLSGGPLHRRGYREGTVEAPMQETLAAAVIRLTGWDGSRPLYDPMCGSGTLLCEALMAFCGVPAAYLRKRLGFELLPDFDKNGWLRRRAEIDQGIRPLPAGLVSGSDISQDAVRAAAANRLRLPHGRRIRIEERDFMDIPGLRDMTIVCNPPYGLRLGAHGDLKSFYGDLGDFLKRRCTGSSAFIYFGRTEFIPAVGLRPTWKKALRNGGLDGRLVRFDIF